MMPEIDGYEVCRRLKADAETRLLPVVFLTGLDSREARLQGLEPGATDFLSKPFDLIELEVRVRNLVSLPPPHPGPRQRRADAVRRSREPSKRATRAPATTAIVSRMLAARLGERLGLDEESVKALRRAGYLHDIGKIGIPDAMLLKPGRLTDEEWVVMRSPRRRSASSICAPLRTLRSVLPIIRHHHEKQDGSGYPNRLKGEEIPLARPGLPGRRRVRRADQRPAVSQGAHPGPGHRGCSARRRHAAGGTPRSSRPSPASSSGNRRE